MERPTPLACSPLRFFTALLFVVSSREAIACAADAQNLHSWLVSHITLSLILGFISAFVMKKETNDAPDLMPYEQGDEHAPLLPAEHV